MKKLRVKVVEPVNVVKFEVYCNIVRFEVYCSNIGFDPVGTWRQNDDVLTSMWHHWVASKSLQCHTSTGKLGGGCINQVWWQRGLLPDCMFLFGVEMDGWMTCNFTSFSTVFQSYQDDGRLIMKGSMQWSSIYGWENFAWGGDQTQSARSVSQPLTHWATGARGMEVEL